MGHEDTRMTTGRKERRMPRIVKHPDQRKSELLDCAQSLFFQQGYDATSVNDVIAKAGISKGAFYHHYPSKEALLEGLAARLARRNVAQLQDILDDPSLDALSRLNSFLSKSRHMKVESARETWAAFEAVFRPENIVLYHRTHAALIAVMTPVLTKIISQGIEELRFKVPDAEGTAEMILHLVAATRESVARALTSVGRGRMEEAADALERRFRFQGIAVDRILGLPDGTVQFVEPGFVRALLAARPS
jgi:AcrR family transcriptional regulator